MSKSERFDSKPLRIDGVFAIKRMRLGDDRGSISRLFCSEELQQAGWNWPISQVNLSHTGKTGTVRGMHYQQAPHTEAKLVTCLRGRAWDVALDLRANSPTFMQWCAQEISAENQTALLIPPGCAHGFQTLSDDVELMYLHSHPYVPAADSGVNPLDPRIHIDWPLAVSVISDKDASRALLGDHFSGLHS